MNWLWLCVSFIAIGLAVVRTIALGYGLADCLVPLVFVTGLMVRMAWRVSDAKEGVS